MYLQYDIFLQKKSRRQAALQSSVYLRDILIANEKNYCKTIPSGTLSTAWRNMMILSQNRLSVNIFGLFVFNRSRRLGCVIKKNTVDTGNLGDDPFYKMIYEFVG